MARIWLPYVLFLHYHFTTFKWLLLSFVARNLDDPTVVHFLRPTD